MIRPVHGGNLVWAALLAGCSPSLILDFSASINPLGPPTSAIAAIQGALGSLSAYPDPAYGTLREALGRWHSLPAGWILPGNGAAELLTLAGRALASLESVVMLTPAFGDYGRALAAFGREAIALPLDLASFAELSTTDFSHWVQTQLARTLESCVGSAGALINNPHNPTGCLLRREDLLPLLDRCELVVIDEAFMDFLGADPPESLISLVQAHKNLVIVRSLTKFFSLPGLRLGYAIGHPDRLAQWQKWRDPWPVNTLASAAAEAALQDTAFQQQTWDWLPPARQQLRAGMAALPGLTVYPGSANFLLVKTEASATALQKALLQKHRVLVRDCVSFPELGDRAFRVAVRTSEENQRLLESLADCLLP